MLDLKFYMPDIKVKLNVLFKHFQQFSKLKLLKRNSFTCAKKIPLSFFCWRAFIFPCFHTKTWNLASKYKWYFSAAISKQPLNLLTKGVLHPPPLLVHRELQSLWVEVIALAAKGQKGLHLADDFCFDLTWVYGRCAQGGCLQTTCNCLYLNMCLLQKFPPQLRLCGRTEEMEQGLLQNHHLWVSWQPALVTVPVCSMGQPKIHPTLWLEVEGSQFGGWGEEQYQQPGRWQREVGSQDAGSLVWEVTW